MAWEELRRLSLVDSFARSHRGRHQSLLNDPARPPRTSRCKCLCPCAGSALPASARAAGDSRGTSARVTWSVLVLGLINRHENALHVVAGQPLRQGVHQRSLELLAMHLIMPSAVGLQQLAVVSPRADMSGRLPYGRVPVGSQNRFAFKLLDGGLKAFGQPAQSSQRRYGSASGPHEGGIR